MVNATFPCYLICLFSKKSKYENGDWLFAYVWHILAYVETNSTWQVKALAQIDQYWTTNSTLKRLLKKKRFCIVLEHMLQLTFKSRIIFRVCKPCWLHCSLFTYIILHSCNSWCFWSLLLRPNLTHNFLYFSKFTRIMRSTTTAQT